MIVYEDENISIGLNLKYTCLEWFGKKPTSFKTVSESMQRMVQLYCIYHSKYPSLTVVFNASLTGMDAGNDIITNGFKALFKQGLSTGVIIVHPLNSNFAEIDKSIMSENQQVKVFTSVDRAKQWLSGTENV
jgi:hypothetical protein